MRKIFQTESCYDFLQVRDGGSAAPILDKHCGTSIPQITISTGNQLHLQFESDGATQKKGFALTFMEGTNVPAFFSDTCTF